MDLIFFLPITTRKLFNELYGVNIAWLQRDIVAAPPTQEEVLHI